MIALAFTVPGPVRGKGRPRFGNGRTYTDTKTASYENLVALSAKAAMGAAAPFSCALHVTLTARIIPPSSASRKARAAMLSGEVPPAKKPDIDNAAKAALDGLNGIAFTDDALIVSLFARKIYAETAGMDVVIRPYQAPEAMAVAA